MERVSSEKCPILSASVQKNKMQTNVRIGIVVFGISLFATFPSAAIPPTGRTISGNISSIHPAKNEITVKPDGQADPLLLRWRKRTLFFENRRATTANRLTSDTRVTVRYRQPWIGPRIATRIFIQSQKQ